MTTTKTLIQCIECDNSFLKQIKNHATGRVRCFMCKSKNTTKLTMKVPRGVM